MMNVPCETSVEIVGNTVEKNRERQGDTGGKIAVVRV